jgi:hypothetical protein
LFRGQKQRGQGHQIALLLASKPRTISKEMTTTKSKAGRPLVAEQDKTVVVGFSIKPYQEAWLKQEAARYGVSNSKFEQAIIEYLMLRDEIVHKAIVTYCDEYGAINGNAIPVLSNIPIWTRYASVLAERMRQSHVQSISISITPDGKHTASIQPFAETPPAKP